MLLGGCCFLRVYFIFLDVCRPYVCNTHSNQKRASDTLELELQAVISAENQTQEQLVLLAAETSLQPPCCGLSGKCFHSHMCLALHLQLGLCLGSLGALGRWNKWVTVYGPHSLLLLCFLAADAMWSAGLLLWPPCLPCLKPCLPLHIQMVHSSYKMK